MNAGVAPVPRVVRRRRRPRRNPIQLPNEAPNHEDPEIAAGDPVIGPALIPAQDPLNGKIQ